MSQQNNAELSLTASFARGDRTCSSGVALFAPIGVSACELRPVWTVPKKPKPLSLGARTAPDVETNPDVEFDMLMLIVGFRMALSIVLLPPGSDNEDTRC
jgi:hypothetical protein